MVRELLHIRPVAVSRPTRHSILRGVMVFRWLSFTWAVGIFLYEIYDRNVRAGTKANVAHPWEGVGAFVAVLVFLLLLGRAYLSNPDSIMRPAWILTEIGLAAALLLLDVRVYGSPNHSQALPTVWPIAVIATVALAGGQRSAVVTGFGLGVARYVGWIPYNETPWSLTRTSSLVLMMIAGWSAGYLWRRLEAADSEISAFRAREEVANTLHDGVLQTLAVIQRRSDDAELVTLARTQERELRDYLFSGAAEPGDLAVELRTAARRAEEMFGFEATVVCAPDLPSGPTKRTTVVVAAVTEALNNIGKHADASRVTIYAEPDFVDDNLVFVSVKDDGVGFDPSNISAGQGLQGSITGRMATAGGRSDITSKPGAGTEIQLWL